MNSYSFQMITWSKIIIFRRRSPGHTFIKQGVTVMETRIYPAGPVGSLIRRIRYLQRLKREALDLFETLTEREVEVLALIASGLQNPAIAEQLDISRATVQNHRSAIRNKMKIDNQTDYIKYALAFDLIQF